MSVTVLFGSFEWNADKSRANALRHGLDFYRAAEAFADTKRVIAVDELHSTIEPRYFCMGKVGNRIATVRFTSRRNRIRIIGAGFWRKGKLLYEKKDREKS